MPIRVLIADDHGIVRSGLRALLSAEADLVVVGETGDGSKALDLTAKLQPDVVLMDISMPGLDGIKVTRYLSERHPQVRVVLLTVHEDEALLREALRAGAAGYVTKRAVESELINAIRAAAAGGVYIHPSMTCALLEDRRWALTSEPDPVPLTPRERQVLQLIAHGHTNREIAELLHLSPRTVETHRANVRSKLNLQSRGELVRYAVRHGLLGTEPP